MSEAARPSRGTVAVRLSAVAVFMAAVSFVGVGYIPGRPPPSGCGYLGADVVARAVPDAERFTSDEQTSREALNCAWRTRNAERRGVHTLFVSVETAFFADPGQLVRARHANDADDHVLRPVPGADPDEGFRYTTVYDDVVRSRVVLRTATTTATVTVVGPYPAAGYDTAAADAAALDVARAALAAAV